MITPFNFHSAKIICKPNSVFELDFLEAFHTHKNHNNVLNYDFAAPNYKNVGNLTLPLIPPGLSFFTGLYKYIFLPFSYWSIPWLLLFTVRSADKLHIRAKFSISLYTEYGKLNVTETAVCNFSDFYRCSKLYSFSC